MDEGRYIGILDASTNSQVELSVLPRRTNTGPATMHDMLSVSSEY